MRETGGLRRGVRGEPWWIIEGNAPTTIKLQRKSYSLAESLLPERRTAVCLAGCGWLSEEIPAFLPYWFHWGKNHQTESHIFHVQFDVSGDTQPPVKLPLQSGSQMSHHLQKGSKALKNINFTKDPRCIRRCLSWNWQGWVSPASLTCANLTWI